MSNYLVSISHDENRKDSTIHDPKSKLKVRVSDAVMPAFKPCDGEVSFYVTSSTETLAFETMGYKKHRELLILHMISWYCVYLGLFEAQIHASLPM